MKLLVASSSVVVTPALLLAIKIKYTGRATVQYCTHEELPSPDVNVIQSMSTNLFGSLPFAMVRTWVPNGRAVLLYRRV